MADDATIVEKQTFGMPNDVRELSRIHNSTYIRFDVRGRIHENIRLIQDTRAWFELEHPQVEITDFTIIASGQDSTVMSEARVCGLLIGHRPLSSRSKRGRSGMITSFRELV